MYGAVPSVLERVVPSSTTKNGISNEPFDLMGCALPPGTVVATQAWSMHRGRRSLFLPDRWLLATEAQLAQMLHFMCFDIDPRICKGTALAMLTAPMAVATLSGEFEVVAAEGKDEKSMELRNGFKYDGCGYLYDVVCELGVPGVPMC